MFETRIGRAKDGSWAFAIHEFLTRKCIASEAGFIQKSAAREAAKYELEVISLDKYKPRGSRTWL